MFCFILSRKNQVLSYSSMNGSMILLLRFMGVISVVVLMTSTLLLFSSWEDSGSCMGFVLNADFLHLFNLEQIKPLVVTQQNAALHSIIMTGVPIATPMATWRRIRNLDDEFTNGYSYHL